MQSISLCPIPMDKQADTLLFSATAAAGLAARPGRAMMPARYCGSARHNCAPILTVPPEYERYYRNSGPFKTNQNTRLWESLQWALIWFQYRQESPYEC